MNRPWPKSHAPQRIRVVSDFEVGVLLSAVRGEVAWAIGALTTSGDRKEDDESKASD